MTKRDRHEAIKSAILNNEINNQDSLLNILLDKGFELTQATLSRDMKELKVVKVPRSQGDYTYQLAENPPELESEVSQLSTYGFISIDFSGNLAVVKTRAGYAMGIAAEIDKKIKHEILGTVAGDDTILLIIKEGISRKDVLAALSKFININKSF